jgi:glutathione synthase/RimK-type ligase-like ATP-grasp enzyme
MRREMDIAVPELIATAQLPCADRVGLAKLTTMAAAGADLRPLWHALIAKLMDGTIEAGEGLDLSLIAQLLGDKEAGLAIQHEILKSHQLFRSKRSMQATPLRVLALAAATDMGSNTPIEFLLENPAIELMTLYVIPEIELPRQLPEHDIAIMIASDSEDCRDALRMIDDVAAHWPRPLLNPPHRVCNLDRDKLHGLLTGIEGLAIPATVAVTRTQFVTSDLAFPIIVRPRGSHAGKGLAKIDDVSALENYLGQQQAEEFFVSRFVDYSGDDGLFRKLRIVIVDGKPYACHLAVADRWDIWYLNAGMTQSAGKRLEEETFMQTFDIGFARRHATALAGMIDRIGLDYFMVDCAETKDGSLLIFEADNTAIVHNMDPPEIFPYKAPQMQKVFDAFAAMLERRARHAREQAA